MSSSPKSSKKSSPKSPAKSRVNSPVKSPIKSSESSAKSSVNSSAKSPVNSPEKRITRSSVKKPENLPEKRITRSSVKKPENLPEKRITRSSLKKPVVKSGESIGILKWASNSCYLDSFLMSVMHVNNSIIHNIINAPVRTDLPDKKMISIAESIKDDLKSIYDHIKTGEDRMTCKLLRSKFSAFYKLYQKYDENAENINWTTKQQEPADVIALLNNAFDLTSETLYQEKINTQLNNPVSVLFNDFNIDNDILLSKSSIKLKDYLPIFTSKFTNNISKKELTKKKTYIKSNGLFVNIRRAYHEGEYLEENITEHKSFTSVIPEESIKLIDGTILHLTSIIIHHGKSISGGHYTCYIKRKNKWYHFDDRHDDIELIGSLDEIEEDAFKNVTSFVYV